MVNSSTMTLIVIVMAIYFIGMIAISWVGRNTARILTILSAPAEIVQR